MFRWYRVGLYILTPSWRKSGISGSSFSSSYGSCLSAQTNRDSEHTAADPGRSQCCLCLYHLRELNQRAFSRMQPHCPNQMLPGSLILSPNSVQLVFSVYLYSLSGLSMNIHSSPACLWCPAFWDTFHSYSLFLSSLTRIQGNPEY